MSSPGSHARPVPSRPAPIVEKAGPIARVSVPIPGEADEAREAEAAAVEVVAPAARAEAPAAVDALWAMAAVEARAEAARWATVRRDPQAIDRRDPPERRVAPARAVPHRSNNKWKPGQRSRIEHFSGGSARFSDPVVIEE